MLSDKVCVITGSGAGIGRATALEMARRGARVVVSDIDDDTGRETLALVEVEGGEAVYAHCDVAEEDQLAALMAAAVDAFGGIDVLHNNAGTTDALLEGPATVESLAPEIWDRVMAVNLRGAWLAIKHAAPHLRASTRGPAIVNAASVGGSTAYPGTPSYCISKAGMIQLTKQAAVDLAPTVRVNCYCPAAVQTGMIQAFMDTVSTPEEADALHAMLIGSHLIPRLGAPEDVAQLVCFLASDEASFITGAAYEIDGGSLAWRGTN
jgi:NAD(P)-dependent dehydrogenase (short-subunit alcohol dehydrogenase family)